MEIKKFKRGENLYEFVCEYWETTYAWGHKVTLFKNGLELNVAKIRYYNRTWEMYTYQSTMGKVLEQEIEKREQKAIEIYKWKNDVKRLSKEKKEQILETCYDVRELKDLKKKIYDGQRNGDF